MYLEITNATQQSDGTRQGDWNKVKQINTRCRGLITTGVGKFYSNGGDIKRIWSYEVDVQTFRNDVRNLLWRIAHFPVPTVAVINGHAFGVGAFITLSHDYRVMCNDKGWISWNEVKHNVQIQPSTLQLVRCKFPTNKAIKDGMIFGIRFSGYQALELQIVDVLTDRDSLIKEARTLLNSILNAGILNRKSLRDMKADIYPRRLNESSKL